MSKFYPEPKQAKALRYLLDNETDEILFGGAAGGGKSYLGCAWLLIMCKEYPGSRWLMGRSELKQLKATTLMTFFKVCRDFDIKMDSHYKYNSVSGEINFSNGSQILLMDLVAKPSDPDFDDLGSLEIAGAFLDEVAQISRRAREIVKSRLGWKMEDGKEIKTKLYMSCNPNKGFSYKDFYLPYRDGTLPDNLKFVPALAKDNKHLSEGRRKSLNNLMGVDRLRLTLGNWEFDNDPSALIEYDNILNMFTNTHILSYDNNKKLVGTKRSDSTIYKNKCITWDVAGKGKDSAVILVWCGLCIIEYKVIPKDDGTIQMNTIKAYQTQYNIPNSSIIFDNDGIGGLAGRDFPGAISFNNNSSPLNKENYSNLKSQCYFKLSEVINNNEILFYLEDDLLRDRLVEELEWVKRKDIDKDGKLSVLPKEIIKTQIGRSPDISDAMMLRMYLIVKNTPTDFNSAYDFSSF